MNPAVPVRACALILSGRDVCLIHRRRPTGDLYSLPGGIVEHGEDALAALARELGEELGLDTQALPEKPKLRWIQEQSTTRPGDSRPFLRRHLIHTLHLPTHLRHHLASAEQDADDTTRVVWIEHTEAAVLHLYPAIGGVIREPAIQAPGTVVLRPITDSTYAWR